MPINLKKLVKGNSLLSAVLNGARYSRRLIRSFRSMNQVNSYFQSHQSPKLQIGSGVNVLSGWLNTDFSLQSPETVFLDATKQFNFNDSTFECVFSEHQIEQLTYENGTIMLRECYRVLKPGGFIRIATTSLDDLIGLYNSRRRELQEQYIKWILDKWLPGFGIYKPCFVLNNAFHNWEHKFLYDQATLEESLKKVGFVEIDKYFSGESNNPELRGIESHGSVMGNEDMTRFETLILEARRPCE